MKSETDRKRLVGQAKKKTQIYLVTALLLFVLGAPGALRAQTAGGDVDARLKFLSDGYTQAADAALFHQRLWTVFYTGSMLANIASAGAAGTPEPEIPVSNLLLARTAGVSDEILLGLAARDSYRVRITELERALAFQAFGTNGLAFTEAMSENHDEYITERRGKERSTVAAITSGLGLLVVRLRPHPALTEYEKIEKMPMNTADEKRRKLKALEAWYARGAAAEQRAVSARSHIIAGTVSAIAGMGITAGYGQPARFGYLQFALTLVSAELRILTFPTGLSDTREAYGKKGYASGDGSRRNSIQFAGILATPSSVAVVFRF